MKAQSSIAAGILIGFGIIYSIASITTIDAGKTGVLVKQFGEDKGVQKTSLSVGTWWIDPIIYDVFVYDYRLKQYKFPGVPSTTKDGQPIEVDMSLELGLIPDTIRNLHENIGPDYYDQVILPATRSVLRNMTTTKLSDEIYTGDGRKSVQTRMTEILNGRFNKLGINVIVNLRAIKFQNAQFVATLENKARAAQLVEIEKRNAEAAKNTAIKVANLAEGEKQKRIKAAEAKMEEQRLEGIGLRKKLEQEAKGNLAILKANAEGKRLMNAAMIGPGAKNIVSMEWAKMMGPNIKVWGVPTGSAGTTSIMDLNGILKGAFKGAQ